MFHNKMNFDSVPITGADYVNKNQPPKSQHIYCEVALVDRTHHPLKPILHILKNGKLKVRDITNNISGNEYLLRNRDLFEKLGVIVSINEKKKQIVVKNGNVITYEHLIIYSGTVHSSFDESDQESFNQGLQALIYALKLKDTLPKGFELIVNQENKKNVIQKNGKTQIQELANPKISISKEASNISILSNSDKKMYEVKL